MLSACPDCHRQYDVQAHQPGTQLRCFCGQLFSVKQAGSRQVQMLHCSHCGGALEQDASSCAWCQGDVLLGDRGLGEACPECFARMVKDASYCSTCGTAIRPEFVIKALASQDCPRCRSPLALCESESDAYIECTSCGGVWLHEGTFERLAQSRQAAAVAEVLPGRMAQGLQRQAPETLVRYLRCPVCSQHMNRQSFARVSGVVIDWCRGHGYWFDTHELERILEFIEAGGLERARSHRVEQEKLDRERERRRDRLTPSPSVAGQAWRHRERPLLRGLVDLIEFLF